MNSHNQHNDDCSQKHLKFLVRLRFSGSYYYTIWGSDLTTFNQEDKVLIDSESHFLLFTDTSKLFRFTENTDNLFDKENFLLWLNEIVKPIEPNTTINLDVLNYDSINLDDAVEFTELVDAKNFISDYTYQIDSALVDEIILSDEVQELYDLYMDNYIWSGEKKPIRKGLAEDVIPLFKRLYVEIAKQIKVI